MDMNLSLISHSDVEIEYYTQYFWAHLCNLHGGLMDIAFRPSSLDQNSDLIIIHISKSITPRAMKFCQTIDVDEPMDDLEGQGHGSKVKVTI